MTAVVGLSILSLGMREKILIVHSKDILAIFSKNVFFWVILNSLRVFLMLVLVLLVMCPDERT